MSSLAVSRFPGCGTLTGFATGDLFPNEVVQGAETGGSSTTSGVGKPEGGSSEAGKPGSG